MPDFDDRPRDEVFSLPEATGSPAPTANPPAGTPTGTPTDSPEPVPPNPPAPGSVLPPRGPDPVRAARTARRAGLAKLPVFVGAGALIVAAVAVTNTVGRVTETQVTTHAGITTLAFAAMDSADVTVHSDPAATGVTVRARISVTRFGSGPKVQETVDGARLTVANACRGVRACGVDYSVTVPPGVSVSVESTSGDVQVEGLAGLTATTGSGDVRSRSSTGPIEIHTGSGDVEVHSSTAPQTVSVTTGSGDVAVDVPSAAYDLSTVTSSGDVNSCLPASTGTAGRITVVTGSGDIDVCPGVEG